MRGRSHVTSVLASLVSLAAVEACGGSAIPAASDAATEKAADESFPDAVDTMDGERAPVVLPRPVAAVPYIDVSKTATDCSTPMGMPYKPSSASEVVSLLTGRWRRCEGTLSLGSAADGMELDRDRRWIGLQEADGVLVPAPGPGAEAIWFLTAEDPSDVLHASINFLRLIFVAPEPDPATKKSAYIIELFQPPNRVRLGGTTTFAWLGG
jgi:hypothetical protein